MLVPHQRKRNTSIHSLNQDMPSPSSSNSPKSPMAPSMLEHSPPVAASNPKSHSRDHSIDPSQDNKEKGSQRKTHSYKRTEEPPRNEDGKMVCKHQECHGTSFSRKCDWNKHMDKHDRPYKCNDKGCEKLQGFTYSGGLLRHEREVHGMHGSAKNSLFCPSPDCKRSSGDGFTRKENLAEHLRRVHRRMSMSEDMHGLAIRHNMVRHEIEESPIRDSGASESTYNRLVEYCDEEDIRLKRKREDSDSEIPGHHDNDEMRSQLKRLKQENKEKDAQLKIQEQEIAGLQQQADT